MSEEIKIQNKEMLLYSAEKSVNEVRKLKYEDVSDKEAYYRIGTAIHWLMDCIDRIEKSEKEFESQVKPLISGLRFVNNNLKHEPSFTRVDTDERQSFSPTFFLKFGSKYDFANLDNVNHDENDGRYKNYTNVLEGRDIIGFLSAVLDTVKNYYKDL